MLSSSPEPTVQVHADIELQNRVLEDLHGGPRVSSGLERTALKRTYEQWLGPLTQQMPAAAAPGGCDTPTAPLYQWQTCMPIRTEMHAECSRRPGSAIHSY